MKRGITVTYKTDERGWGFKRIAKAKGELTIEEIRQALIDDGDQGYYAVLVKAVDDDMLQYYDDDLPEDEVECYDADTFMVNSGRQQ